MKKHAPEARRATLLFLGSAIALSASVAAERMLVGRDDDTTRDERALARALREHLDPSGELLVLGRAYIEALPTRPMLGEIVRELTRSRSGPESPKPSGPGARAAGATHAESARELALRIEADFALGRIITVSGWLLSRTEAALCAMMVLA